MRMLKEKTIILAPLTSKRIVDIKEEIIQEAIERNIQNSTIITANLIRNTIYITSSNEEFIRDLSSSNDFVVSCVVPLN